MYNITNESMNEYNNFFENDKSFTSPQMQFSNYSLHNLNNINMISINEEDNTEYLNSINHITSYYLIKKPELEMENIIKDTKSTSINKNQNNEESHEPELYTSKDILSIFNKQSNKNIFKEILENLKFSEDIEYDLQLTTKKRLRFDFDYNKLILKLDESSKNDEKKNKKGRKTNGNNKRETHDKNHPDNIIKKVKVAIFNYSLYFLNNLLKENFRYKVELLKLNYKFVNRMKKEQELEFLNMSLKDLFSKEISPKYINKNNVDEDYNKGMIEQILKDADDTILFAFAFNMTLREWLDIFTLKKSVKDIINENNNNMDCQNKIEKIEKSLVTVDKLLNEINKKNNNDKDYMARFIFGLYNYERWFHLKKCRKK